MASQGTEQVRATIAANIDLAIVRAGKTNRAVGEQMGASEAQVWKWRRAKTGISHDSLIRLAEVLERDWAWFYADHSVEAAA